MIENIKAILSVTMSKKVTKVLKWWKCKWMIRKKLMYVFQSPQLLWSRSCEYRRNWLTLIFSEQWTSFVRCARATDKGQDFCTDSYLSLAIPVSDIYPDLMLWCLYKCTWFDPLVPVIQPSSMALSFEVLSRKFCLINNLLDLRLESNLVSFNLG